MTPLVLGRAVDDGVIPGDLRDLLLWCGVLAGLGVVEAVASAVRHRHAASSFAESSARLRQQLLDRALVLDAGFHDRVPAAAVLARATSDVERVGRLMDCVPHTVAYAVSLLGTAVVLTVMDPRMALLTLGGLASLPC